MIKKVITYTPLLLILFQSCVVYHRQSVSLYQASNAGKVKITTNMGEKLIAASIYSEDSIYYAKFRIRIKNENGDHKWEENNTIINSKDISTIQLKNIEKSKRKTVFGFLIFPIVLILLFPRVF